MAQPHLNMDFSWYVAERSTFKTQYPRFVTILLKFASCSYTSLSAVQRTAATKQNEYTLKNATLTLCHRRQIQNDRRPTRIKPLAAQILHTKRMLPARKACW
jgi:hypothetical protein